MTLVQFEKMTYSMFVTSLTCRGLHPVLSRELLWLLKPLKAARAAMAAMATGAAGAASVLVPLFLPLIRSGGFHGKSASIGTGIFGDTTLRSHICK